MNARRILLILFLAAAALAAVSHQGPNQVPDYYCPDCNVVLISLDTLRADHLGSYGYYRNTSPNIDALAQKGVLYEKTISQSSWTLPSHVSMFTSLYASDLALGFFPMPSVIPEQVATLTELLLADGYVTAGFHGGSYLSGEYGFYQGFQEYSSGGPRMEDNSHNVSRWLEANHGRKFFLFLHSYNCHSPYTPPEPYDTLFTNWTLPYDENPNLSRGDAIDEFTRNLASVYGESGGLPEKNRPDLDYIISQYDGEIAYADYLVGEFVKELNGYGILNKTIIVITSDHGEEFLEHGRFHHVNTLYDELVHVPLIVYSPALPDGVRVKEQVRSVDIMPSILELAGVRYSGPVRGETIIPFTWGKTRKLTAISETSKRDKKNQKPNTRVDWYLQSVRADGWKLVYNETNIEVYDPEEQTQRLDRSFSYELFNLRDDPLESFDLSRSERRMLLRLGKKLVDEPIIEGQQAEEVAVDETVEEQLRALGYIQ